MKKTVKEPEVISALHLSDPAAFDFVFDSYYTSLCYFAFQLTGNLPEAEDIVSESFQKFWERRHNFHLLTNIKAFLYITVRNTCLNYIRSNSKQQKRTQELAYHHADLVEKSAENFIIETEFLQAVYIQINSLPPKCRQVFVMKYFKGLGIIEIARQLGISENTARNHIAYSLKLLRNALGSQLLMVCLYYLSGVHHTIYPSQPFPLYPESLFPDSCFSETMA